METAALNARWAEQIVAALQAAGVRRFVVAPGARSTPLVAAVARSGSPLTVISDERVGAFVALGLGQAMRAPAALITTSGSACTHAHPAIVEASASEDPLLIISADRPSELHGVGANQATPQRDLFIAHAGPTVALPDPQPGLLRWLGATVADGARRAFRGPVHINVPFRKPLIEADDAAAEVESVPSYFSARRTMSAAAATSWLQGLKATRRGLVVVGRLANEESRVAVQRFVESLGWPVLADVTSGVPGLPQADALLRSDAIKADTVLHLGGRIVSAEVERWLRRTRPERHWIVGPHTQRWDPAGTVTAWFEADFETLPQGGHPHPELAAIQALATSADSAVQSVLEDLGAATAPGMARAVWGADSTPLIIGNSTPVRDFADYRGSAHRLAHASRGVSGIDGTVATAIGWARAIGPTTVVLGDQAMLHDLGALASVGDLPLRIVVLNNDGGAIFERLAIAQHPALLERCFVAPHGRDFRAAAAMFGLPYRTELGPFAGPELIEITTDREVDAALRARLNRVADSAISSTRRS